MSLETAKEGAWNFDNSYARLPERFFERVLPQAVKKPRLIRLNESLAKLMDLRRDFLRANEAADCLSGNRIPEGADVIAQAYAGHQFGHFVPRLGDGRALLLGEHLNRLGQRFDIQLKGSGRTPFSRSGDGRAALGPMMREYIVGEALFNLGIPTTRSLALVSTGEEVQRDRALPGAIVTRVAASHVRIGTFEYFASRQDWDGVRILADYVMNRHYPECSKQDAPYQAWIEACIERQAVLVAQWMLVGFVHGVINTDNVALSGESIDFGPCAFIDAYDPGSVFSSIDSAGRYALGAQPGVMQWNLARFVESVLPLLDADSNRAVEVAQKSIDSYPAYFERYWLDGMRNKLGLHTTEDEDKELVLKFLEIMESNKLDYSLTFRRLSHGEFYGGDLQEVLSRESWWPRWQARLENERNGRSLEDSLSHMRARNPARIPRNYLVEEAIEAGVERGEFSVMDDLLSALERPYEEIAGDTKYSAAPPASWQGYQTFCGT